MQSFNFFYGKSNNQNQNLVTNNEKTLESEEKIQLFTNNFPQDLSNMVLSYLPHSDLSKIINTESKEFETQFYLQKPARKMLDESWKSLTENLIKVINIISNDNIYDISRAKDANESVYYFLCREYKDELIKTVNSFADADQKIIDENKFFLLDCAMHAVAGISVFINELLKDKNLEDKPAEGILRNTLLQLFPFANKNNLLDFWLDAGFPLQFKKTEKLTLESTCYSSYSLGRERNQEGRENHELPIYNALIFKAIMHNVPANTIRKLIERGIEDLYYFSDGSYKVASMVRSAFLTVNNINNPFSSNPIKIDDILMFNEEYYNHFYGIYFTPLFYSLLKKSDDKIISLLIEKFPHQIDMALDAVTKIKDLNGINLNLLTAIHLEEAKLGVTEKIHISTTEAQNIKIRLLLLTDLCENKSQIVISSTDKSDILKILNEQINKTSKLDDCIALYDKHINASYINNAYRPKLDSLICAITGYSTRYTNTKLSFINSIRKKIYSILNSSEYFNQFSNPQSYLEICHKLLNHPIYSDEHDKYGVDKTDKSNLIAKTKDIENILQVTLIKNK